MPLDMKKTDQEVVEKLLSWVNNFDSCRLSYKDFFEGIEPSNKEFFRRYNLSGRHERINEGYLEAMRLADEAGLHDRPFYININQPVRRRIIHTQNGIQHLLMQFEIGIVHQLLADDPEGRREQFWQLAEEMCREVDPFLWPEIQRRLRILAARLGSAHAGERRLAGPDIPD